MIASVTFQLRKKSIMILVPHKRKFRKSIAELKLTADLAVATSLPKRLIRSPVLFFSKKAISYPMNIPKISFFKFSITLCPNRLELTTLINPKMHVIIINAKKTRLVN